MQGHAKPFVSTACSSWQEVSQGNACASKATTFSPLCYAWCTASEATHHHACNILPPILMRGRRSTDLERVMFGGDIPPGTLVNYWVRTISKFIRSIDANHMVRPTALKANLL